MMPKLQWLLIGSASFVAAHSLRGAEAFPRRHLRGAADRRVLHTDDLTDTVVDNPVSYTHLTLPTILLV